VNEELMTRGDRQELAKLARLRERVAKADASRRAAELKADFEQQIAAIYSFDDDDVWRASRAAVSEETDRANAAITQRCRELGIPDEFAPSVASGWISRGQNAAKGRRDELRRVAYTRIDQLEGRETRDRSALPRSADGTRRSRADHDRRPHVPRNHADRRTANAARERSRLRTGHPRPRTTKGNRAVTNKEAAFSGSCSLCSDRAPTGRRLLRGGHRVPPAAGGRRVGRLTVRARRAKLSEEKVALASAGKLWAERRAGELLLEVPREKGGYSSHSGTSTGFAAKPVLTPYQDALAENGVSKMTASVRQRAPVHHARDAE